MNMDKPNLEGAKLHNCQQHFNEPKECMNEEIKPLQCPFCKSDKLELCNSGGGPAPIYYWDCKSCAKEDIFNHLPKDPTYSDPLKDAKNGKDFEKMMGKFPGALTGNIDAQKALDDSRNDDAEQKNFLPEHVGNFVYIPFGGIIDKLEHLERENARLKELMAELEHVNEVFHYMNAYGITSEAVSKVLKHINAYDALKKEKL